MSYEFVTYEKRDRIATITLNRPEVMNALHLEAHFELKEIWEDFRDDPELWVAILTGAGERAFSAGNDLKVTAERTASGADVQGRERPQFGRHLLSGEAGDQQLSNLVAKRARRHAWRRF